MGQRFQGLGFRGSKAIVGMYRFCLVGLKVLYKGLDQFFTHIGVNFLKAYGLVGTIGCTLHCDLTERPSRNGTCLLICDGDG